MWFAFNPSARTSRLNNYYLLRFISSRLLLFIVRMVIVVLLALTPTGGRIAAAATSSFGPKQDFATGATPRAVSEVDLNGDGKLDLVTANVNDNTVSVLLNNTAPGAVTTSFAPKQDFATGAGPISVAVGDLNGDGKPDLATANFNANTISVLINITGPGAATPGFAAKQDFATAGEPIFGTVADLNGDGKLDVATVNLFSNNVSVLLNTTIPGANIPSFAASQEFATGPSPVSLTACDLNSDGKLDLAVTAIDSDTVSVLLNTTAPGAGTPSFAAKQDFATGSHPQSVTNVDLNGDGKLDLVVANAFSDTLSVFINNTTPGATTQSFAAKQDFATGSSPITVTAGDLNGDGKFDLVVTNFGSDSVSVLPNTTTPGAATPSFGPKQDFAAGDGPVFVSSADLNGDGKLDLAVENFNSNTVSVLLNTTDPGPATPGFAVKQDVQTGSNPRSVSVGDFNRDGKLDLVVANSVSNTVSVLLNTTAPGSATSTFAPKQDFATGTGPVFVTVADLNRDGKLDIAVANINSNTVSVLLNATAPGAATPSFAAKQDFPTGDNPLSVAIGDLNGDGKLDLVVANLIATVSVLLNTTTPGANTSSFAVKQDFVTGDGPRSVAIGDLNGDGKLDLAIVSFNSNTVAVLLNTTEPGAATPSFTDIHDFPTGIRPVGVSLSDLNGDGKLDLAVLNVNSNNVSVLLNTTTPGAPTPSFAAKEDFDTGGIPRSIAVGDLNGDGKPELAVVKSISNTVAVLLNTTAPGAAASFAAKQDFDTGANPLSITIGDLNGDGKLDLASANFDSDTVSVLLNTPTIVTATDLSVQQGSAARTAQIANVSGFGGNGSLSITVTSTNPTNGVTISNIINTGGNVKADIVASCGASNASFTLQASDGSSTVSTTVHIAVTANTAPTLTYQNQSVALNGSLTINPATGPADNGGFSIVKQSSGTYTGDIGVDQTTGIVSINNATPAGTHTITIRVTDNCGATTDTSFTLTVGKANQTITFGALANKNVGDPDFSVNATATSGLPVSFAASGQCTVSGNTVHITGAGLCTITASQAGDSNFNPAPEVRQSFTIVSSANSSLITLSQANYNVNESSGFVTVTVNRTGDLSTPVSVNYATDDTGSSNVCGALNTGLASQRCDFGLTLGALLFAPNDTQKTFIIPITQDSYTEGPETFTVNLSNLNGNGTNFGTPSSATVTIADETTQLPPNPSDDTDAFVRQQYRDFLNREADPAGLAFWTGEINNCTPKPQCTQLKRINVSAAFFLSIEFQTTGILVRNFYVAALDRPATNNMPAFVEFERDTQAIQRGVIVDPSSDAFQIVLNNNRDAFMRDFVTRAEFVGLYPTTDTPTQYVDKLYQHAGIAPSAAERAAAIAEFGGAATAVVEGARGRALLDVTQNQTFQQREVNRGFVQMQFFGYLRRNPNDAPDGNFEGFNFWLTKLNQFNGNFVDAEMVLAFISSDEYRHRFGP